MTWRTVKGDMLITLRVPFTVAVDLDEERGEEFEKHQWIEDINDGTTPDALEGATIETPNWHEHEVYESVVADAELVAESSSSENERGDR